MGIIKILKELSYLKRVNVIYEHEYEGMLFVERVFAFDIPKRKEAVVWKGKDYRVGTLWHDKDAKTITVDLYDL